MSTPLKLVAVWVAFCTTLAWAGPASTGTSYTATTIAKKCSKSEHFACYSESSQCVGGKCQCNNGLVGDPYLGCFPPGFTFCGLVNDPRGKTFAGQPEWKGIDIPVPCRYLAAHVDTTSTTPGNSPVSNCDAEVYTAEERFAGKFYVSGFEVLLTYDVPSGTKHFSFRARATAHKGVYTTYLETRPINHGDYASTDSIDQIDTDMGGHNVFGFDEDVNLIKLSIPNCGIELHFRPVDVADHDQGSQAGLIIGVDESNFDVKYQSLKRSFCLSVDVHERSVGAVVEVFKLNADMAFTYRALADIIEQDFPNTSQKKCKAVSDILITECSDVDDRAHAMEMCHFILADPNFINCYMEDEKFDSGALLDVFRLCMHSYCQKARKPCLAAQKLIEGKKCKEKANYIFVGFSCEYHPED